MKYFTYDLWIQTNSQDEDTRIKASLEWSRRDKDYLSQFNRVKGFFTKSFIQSYINYGGFHGGYITSFQFQAERQRFVISVEYYSHTFQIIFDKVNSVVINYCKTYDCEWGYSEIDINDAGEHLMNILCSNGQEISICFSRIRIAKSTK